MRGARLGWVAAAAVMAGAAAAAGVANAQDRTQYTFLKPTPDHLLRNMTTDRPDITETAGVNFGISPAADRFNPFVGLSVRY